MEQWEEGFYITAMAGSNQGSSLVVMSKGTPYTQQSYKVSDSYPFKWISKKWKEGFHVTSMATSKTKWAVVMSATLALSTSVSSWTSSTLQKASTADGMQVVARPSHSSGSMLLGTAQLCSSCRLYMALNQPGCMENCSCSISQEVEVRSGIDDVR